MDNQGRYRLFDLHPGQIQPQPDPDPPPSPEKLEITLNLGSVYGSWKKADVSLSLNRFESTIPGGKKNLEE